MVLVCHMILEDKATKASVSIMCRSPLRLVTSLPCLRALGTVVVEI